MFYDNSACFQDNSACFFNGVISSDPFRNLIVWTVNQASTISNRGSLVITLFFNDYYFFVIFLSYQNTSFCGIVIYLHRNHFPKIRYELWKEENYTVKPQIFNNSKEFMKCRLDNFSMGFILFYVYLSIFKNK